METSGCRSTEITSRHFHGKLRKIQDERRHKIATDSVENPSRKILDKSTDVYGNSNLFNKAVRIAKIINNSNYIIQDEHKVYP